MSHQMLGQRRYLSCFASSILIYSCHLQRILHVIARHLIVQVSHWLLNISVSHHAIFDYHPGILGVKGAGPYAGERAQSNSYIRPVH